MKIQKAIDKARKNQQKNERRDNTMALNSGHEHDDWRAPDYDSSLSVEINEKKAVENNCVCLKSESFEMDHYKVLRTMIEQKAKSNGWNTIMITSPNPGEGKTLTAINLSLTFARAYNQTVLLVDADLRHQKVHEYLGLDSSKGLSAYLLKEKPVEDLFIWPGVEKLTLISGGKPIHNSTELLGSPRMKALVEEMKLRYEDRYILFDAPPLLCGADALSLEPLVDSIVMVVEAGRTSEKDIEKAMELIPKEKFIGFVLNRHQRDKVGMGAYGYQMSTAN
ncbi:MAG: polysaccharide biosynthesis tyrosine autokinase [Desulfobacterales bacterium]|nr:polysaccharide biosynthesis tyrosine autokinase [Desulfobacterales bacterium]